MFQIYIFDLTIIFFVSLFVAILISKSLMCFIYLFWTLDHGSLEYFITVWAWFARASLPKLHIVTRVCVSTWHVCLNMETIGELMKRWFIWKPSITFHFLVWYCWKGCLCSQAPPCLVLQQHDAEMNFITLRQICFHTIKITKIESA